MNRVLIIEDEAVARRQLAQLFRFEDFEVAEAESGQAGIAAAAMAPPDLVVCDIMMPGTDGFGVLRALRNQPGTSLTPFIFLTAKAGGHDVRQGMNEGADDYITKPFDPQALLASARQRIGRRRMQLEEAERRAADTGILAAAVLPTEMEGSLAHLETVSEVLVAKYENDPQAAEMRRIMKEELTRLRTLSQRLRLYAELPSLYARRFSATGESKARSSNEVAARVAQSVVNGWSRASDLQVHVAPGLVALPEEALTVMVRELVDNACKFSTRSTPITVEVKNEPAFWSLTVVDRGLGIPPDSIKEVSAFRQFWNGAERPAGLGLGLVLVQALARLHSAETQIESEPRTGTRITVMIPAE